MKKILRRWYNWFYWHVWHELGQRWYCWRKGVVRVAESICIRSIMVSNRELLASIAVPGKSFTHDNCVPWRMIVEAGARITVNISNLTNRSVPIQGAFFADSSNGSIICPLTPAVLAPRESRLFPIRVYTVCRLRALRIPAYVKKLKVP